jgi:hypothetical protein
LTAIKVLAMPPLGAFVRLSPGFDHTTREKTIEHSARDSMKADDALWMKVVVRPELKAPHLLDLNVKDVAHVAPFWQDCIENRLNGMRLKREHYKVLAWRRRLAVQGGGLAVTRLELPAELTPREVTLE